MQTACCARQWIGDGTIVQVWAIGDGDCNCRALQDREVRGDVTSLVFIEDKWRQSCSAETHLLRWCFHQGRRNSKLNHMQTEAKQRLVEKDNILLKRDKKLAPT